MAGAIQKYPDDSIQSVVGRWWIEDKENVLHRGCLIRAFAPHVDQQAFTLTLKGRTNPTEHGEADYAVTPLRIKAPFDVPPLPIAAMPMNRGELRILQRAKVRPMLIISPGGPDIAKSLRIGQAKWQTSPTLLAAPFYGADQDGTRGGLRPEFVERIRRCEYPQYLWDSLPISGPEVSILRLDHIQPIGRHAEAFELTGYCLSDDALVVLDEWLIWLQLGGLPSEGVLADLRRELLRLG